jgi:hypothetical protein
MRFSAPANVSAISLAAGEFAVVKGFVDVPDDINAGDLAGLAANGFQSAPKGGKAADPAPVAPAPAPAAPEAPAAA